MGRLPLAGRPAPLGRREGSQVPDRLLRGVPSPPHRWPWRDPRPDRNGEGHRDRWTGRSGDPNPLLNITSLIGPISWVRSRGCFSALRAVRVGFRPFRIVAFGSSSRSGWLPALSVRSQIKGSGWLPALSVRSRGCFSALRAVRVGFRPFRIGASRVCIRLFRAARCFGLFRDRGARTKLPGFAASVSWRSFTSAASMPRICRIRRRSDDGVISAPRRKKMFLRGPEPLVHATVRSRGLQRVRAAALRSGSCFRLFKPRSCRVGHGCRSRRRSRVGRPTMLPNACC